MTVAPAQAPARTLRAGAIDPRYLIVFLITLVLVAGEARYRILGGYERLATTLGVCIAAELFLSMLHGLEGDRRLFGMRGRGQKAQDEWARHAVTVFMHAYDILPDVAARTNKKPGKGSESP